MTSHFNQLDSLILPNITHLETLPEIFFYLRSKAVYNSSAKKEQPLDYRYNVVKHASVTYFKGQEKLATLQ